MMGLAQFRVIILNTNQHLELVSVYCNSNIQSECFRHFGRDLFTIPPEVFDRLRSLLVCPDLGLEVKNKFYFNGL